MKLLLRSAGVKNPSIKNALVELLGKPIEESSALCIPTAGYGHPDVGPGPGPWRFISGTSHLHMVDLGWKSMGVLELTALPSIDRERWVPLVRETDVLLANGGDALYLAWVGLSAGPAYAIDDDTAIQVVDGDVEVITEGQRKLFNAGAPPD